MSDGQLGRGRRYAQNMHVMPCRDILYQHAAPQQDRPAPERTVASVPALGLGLCCGAGAVARVDLLRLADDEAVLHQLAHVLACRAAQIAAQVRR